MRIEAWHVHTGPPWLCHGGSDRREDAELLQSVCIEDFGEGTARIVESKDDPAHCAYRYGRPMIRGSA